ncbi:MAG: hypothetical protein H0T66_16555, partial [Geodermatophilaceae bacterium]|nr:hypothetical protein [Geodermatophilaceae bacterium]
ANGIIAATLVVAAVAAVLSLLRRPTPRVVAGAVLGIGAAAVVQAVIALVQFIAGPRPDEPGTFLGYLLSSVLIVPAAWLWARVEPGRWGNGVLCIGCLTLSVMIVRMDQLWVFGG